jgi:hypothetical protein
VVVPFEAIEEVVDVDVTRRVFHVVDTHPADLINLSGVINGRHDLLLEVIEVILSY